MDIELKEKIDKVLPIVTILTLAATGSEMNGNAVILSQFICNFDGYLSRKTFFTIRTYAR